MSFGKRLLRSPLFLSSCVGAAAWGGCMYYKETSTCSYKIDRKLDDVTAVVTGATSGIGLATSMKLAEAGARLIMACRDLDKCREERRRIVLETRNKRVACRQCDLSSRKSIIEFTKCLKADNLKINLLINNAGIMYAPPLPTEDGFEPHLGTNFLGPYLLTLLLVDQLKEHKPSRIVNLADVSCKRANLNFDDLNCSKDYSIVRAHDQSQLARVLATRHLANYLKDSGVTINDVFPGYTETNIGGVKKNTFLRFISWPVRKMGLQSPEKAANVVLQLAVSSEYGGVSGKMFRFSREEKNLKEVDDLNDQCNDKMAQLRLGLIADYWTGAKQAMLN